MKASEKCKRTTKLDLPTFIATRQRALQDELGIAHDYVMKHKHLYAERQSDLELGIVAADKRPKQMSSCVRPKPAVSLSRRRMLMPEPTVAPNQYNIQQVGRGRERALPTQNLKKITTKKVEKWDERPFYTPKAKTSGSKMLTFSTGSRFWKPPVRHFVHSLVHCFREIHYPSPNHYNPIYQGTIPWLSDDGVRDTYVYWRFYPRSAVPIRWLNDHREKPTRLGPGCYNPYKLVPKFVKPKKPRKKKIKRRSLAMTKPPKICCAKYLHVRPLLLKHPLPQVNVKLNSAPGAMKHTRLLHKLKNRVNIAPFNSTTGRFPGDPFLTILNQVPVEGTMLKRSLTEDRKSSQKPKPVQPQPVQSRYLNFTTKPAVIRKPKKRFIASKHPLPVGRVLIQEEDFDFLKSVEDRGYFFTTKAYSDYYKQPKLRPLAPARFLQSNQPAN